MLKTIEKAYLATAKKLKQFIGHRLEESPVLIWTVGCFVAFTYNLAELPPYHTDESYYVESVRTMVGEII